jgi:hypothetical protein
MTEHPPVERDKQFEGRIGQIRYVWHPRVHEYYQERCYIYLVSGDYGEGDKIVAALQAVFARLDIRSTVLNIIYGPYDVLIRVWLTGQSRERLVRALRNPHDSDLTVANLLEFTSDDVVYFWQDEGPAVDSAKISEMSSAIQAVVGAERRGEWDEHAHDSLAQLKKAGLVREYLPPHGAKFHMFFSERGGRRTVPSTYVVRTLLSTARQENVSAVNVHEGVGFCDYVLKGVSPSYDDTLPIVQKFQEVAAGLHLQAWTLVVADYGRRPEGETIDALQSRFPSELDEFLIHRSDPDRVRQQIGSLERIQQSALAQIYTDARAALTTKEFERFAEVLERSIIGDRKALNQSLSFLTSIEGDLRYVLPRILRRHLGTNWHNDILDLRTKLAKADDDDARLLSLQDRDLTPSLQDWSLFQLMMILHRVINGNQRLGTELEDYLDPSWRKSIQKIVRLRNDYAHSKLVESTWTRDYRGEWGEKLRDLMLVIKFQVGIEALKDEIETRQPYL